MKTNSPLALGTVWTAGVIENNETLGPRLSFTAWLASVVLPPSASTTVTESEHVRRVVPVQLLLFRL